MCDPGPECNPGECPRCFKCGKILNHPEKYDDLFNGVTIYESEIWCADINPEGDRYIMCWECWEVIRNGNRENRITTEDSK